MSQAELGPDDLLVSVIIVSYNTREMTRACLASVASQTRLAHEIIVVDNASSDGSAQMIAADFPQVRLLVQSENLGFAAGNNLAASYARGRFVLLLNPDTVVLDHAIDRLVGCAEAHPEALIWGGRTVFAGGALNPWSAWRHMSLWTLLCEFTGLARLWPGSALFNWENYGDWDRQGERAVDVVCGCFFLIGRQEWERLGGFDLAYVMYGEEGDLCLRAKDVLGARPMATGAAQIIHHMGASSNRTMQEVFILKARIRTLRKHLAPIRRPAALALLRFMPFTRFVGAAALHRIRPCARFCRAHAHWADVWARRAEWWDGYPDLDTV